MNNRITSKELDVLWSILRQRLLVDSEYDLADIDMYLNVAPPHRFELGVRQEPEVGSLCDDIEALHKLIQSAHRPATVLDVERFAAIIVAVSAKLK